MNQMNVKEMREVNGGAVYKEYCPYCKKTRSYKYIVLKLRAKLAARRHATNCFYAHNH